VLAETLEAGDYCLLEGKLSWKKEQSKLLVVAFGVERLSTAGVTERDAAPEYPCEGSDVALIVEAPRPAREPKVRKRALAKHL
jgi:hypothetical protein